MRAPLLLLAVLALVPEHARAAEGGMSGRDVVWRVSIDLDQAVGRVTRTAYPWEFAPQRSQGIVIPGYGVVFVLSPRSLPSDGEVVGSHLLRFRAMPRLRMLPEADAQALAAMRKELAAHEKEREEADMALARAMAELEKVARLRLTDANGNLPQVPAVAATLSPVAPVEPPSVPPVEPMAPPMPPPWIAWLGADDLDEPVRDPKVVLADIRSAVTDVLTTEASHMEFLRGDDQVVVAVSFVSDGLFEARQQPSRTLVIRTKKKDLVDRATGRISAEELAKRSEATEY